MNGDHHYDSRKGLLLWTIDLIDKTNSSGAMEFVASPAAPSDSFFPVEVRRGAPKCRVYHFPHCLADQCVCVMSVFAVGFGFCRRRRVKHTVCAVTPCFDAGGCARR